MDSQAVGHMVHEGRGPLVFHRFEDDEAVVGAEEKLQVFEGVAEGHRGGVWSVSARRLAGRRAGYWIAKGRIKASFSAFPELGGRNRRVPPINNNSWFG